MRIILNMNGYYGHKAGEYEEAALLRVEILPGSLLLFASIKLVRSVLMYKEIFFNWKTALPEKNRAINLTYLIKNI